MDLIVRTCPVCGKEFKAKRKDHRYCSRQCYQHAYYLKKRGRLANPEKRICLVCGKEFQAKRKDHRYCSNQCYQQACRSNKTGAAMKLGIRNCSACGKEFQPKKSDQKYCSATCRRRARYLRNRDRYLDDIICPYGHDCFNCPEPDCIAY